MRIEIPAKAARDGVRQIADHVAKGDTVTVTFGPNRTPLFDCVPHDPDRPERLHVWRQNGLVYIGDAGGESILVLSEESK